MLDVADRCPTKPETVNGLEDGDGCPEQDSDQDGIVDKLDKCPSKPETINGVEDEDGCPDKGESKVEMTSERINILDKVYFDTGKASIQDRSFNVLKQVAAVLKANPQVTLVRIDGHTDNVDTDEFNLELSQRRTEAVRQFLVDQGINSGRLKAEGFGETKPIVSNDTEEGRTQNRRVEFTILEIDGKPVESISPVIQQKP